MLRFLPYPEISCYLNKVPALLGKKESCREVVRLLLEEKESCLEAASLLLGKKES